MLGSRVQQWVHWILRVELSQVGLGSCPCVCPHLASSLPLGADKSMSPMECPGVPSSAAVLWKVMAHVNFGGLQSLPLHHFQMKLALLTTQEMKEGIFFLSSFF